MSAREHLHCQISLDEWLCWNKLNFSEVNEKYNGEYTCEVEAKDRNNPKSITHKLLVLQTPKFPHPHPLFYLYTDKDLKIKLSSSFLTHPI